MHDQSQQFEPISFFKSPGPFEHGVFLDLNEQIERVFRDTLLSEESGRRTKMLAKYPEFRIALVAMRSGSRWDDHKTPARIFVQVVRGRIRFSTPDSTFELGTGQLLALNPGVLHSVDCREDSAFLLTLSDARQ